MLRNAILCRLLLAAGASLFAVGAAIILQGAFFMPTHVGSIHSPVQMNVHRLSLAGNGRYVVARLVHYSHAAWHGLKQTLHLGELGDENHLPRMLNLDFVPWMAVGARRANLLFVGSQQGDVYWLDLSSPAARPRLLGTLADGCPTVMECTADGSIVIVGNTAHTSAWRRLTGQCLWQRSDLDIISAHSHNPTNRLFCGLVGGHGVELDPQTGATMDVFDTHCSGPFALDVSQVTQLGMLEVVLPKDGGSFDATKLSMTLPPLVSADPEDGTMKLVLGDVLVCPEVAARQAGELGRTLDEELALLVVHGVLHLLGHDHAKPKENITDAMGI